MTLFEPDAPPESWARISEDGRYRYELVRRWDSGPLAAWIMLNPSTADASTDDHTIRKVTGFCRRWGFGGLHVVNLFALRSRDPALLLVDDDPVGPENDATLDRVLLAAPLAVAAWGAHPAAPERAARVAAVAGRLGRRLSCLGTTLDGAPRHPRTLAYSTPLEVWA